MLIVKLFAVFYLWHGSHSSAEIQTLFTNVLQLRSVKLTYYMQLTCTLLTLNCYYYFRLWKLGDKKTNSTWKVEGRSQDSCKACNVECLPPVLILQQRLSGQTAWAHMGSSPAAGCLLETVKSNAVIAVQLRTNDTNTSDLFHKPTKQICTQMVISPVL